MRLRQTQPEKTISSPRRFQTLKAMVGSDEAGVSLLLRQLAISGAMVLVLAIVHFTVLAILFRWLRALQPRWSTFATAPLPILLTAFGGLLAAHTAEIWMFAGLYVLLDALPDFETALYFSAVSYASVGYGDIVLSKDWRILGAIEGAAGVILLGCSTAFLVVFVTEFKLFDRVRPPSQEERE